MLKDMNQIYCGDNLQIMHGMEDESVDLIYLDPPFFSGQNYEVIWNDGSEVRSFKDTEWYRVECPKCEREVIKADKYCPKCGTSLEDAKITRKNDIWSYIDWMIPRLKEMRRILKPTGSIYLHCDWHAIHYLKVEMDRIFGSDNFQNEIIWHYSNKIGKPSTACKRAHDNVLFYTKTDKYNYNPILEEIDNELTLKRYDHEDEKGVYKIYHTGGVDRKVYLKPKVADDVWNINILSANNSERLGYPTQKPEALLERIIKASSNKGDIVFDPFCGCGTSTAVAQKLERQYIGIDISPVGCKLIAKRVNFPIDDIVGLPRTSDEIGKMEPHEFQNWVCKQMSAKNTSPDPKKASGADGEVDGVIQTPLTNPKYHGSPIQVKQSKKVGVKDIREFLSVMTHRFNRSTDPNRKENNGFVIALSFGKGAKDLVEDYRNDGSGVIHLLTVEDIIDAKDLNDITNKLKD